MKFIFLLIFIISLNTSTVRAACSNAKKVTLSEEVLYDKVKGAWAGQTLGCSYGGPTEFKFLGTIIQEYIPIPWNKNVVRKWYDTFPGLYDDFYVDLTFVEVFEKCGLEAPVDSFANAFKRTEYPLWHANQMARYNLHQGIKPSQCGNWKNNPHASCIDFQIEADFAGIMSPGLVNQSAKICDKIGHIISYGDGWYGGVYVAAMYTMAYISNDINCIVKEALEIIPKQTGFYQCMADVIKWHKKYPNDWKKTWFELQNKWSEENSCPDGIHNSFNIGTKINCAYILLGLLYGGGDFSKTIDISTRAGQDSDCNPASAGGILGTMLGYNKIPKQWQEALLEVENIPFSNTDISLKKAYEISFQHACKMLLKHGAEKCADCFVFYPEKAIPVDLESSFENLKVMEKRTVEQSVKDLGSYSFSGTGVVVKGYLKGEIPIEYKACMDVYVDGELYESCILPAYINHRKCEPFFCYDLSIGKHTLTFKWNNELPNAQIWITEIITYTNR